MKRIFTLRSFALKFVNKVPSLSNTAIPVILYFAINSKAYKK